LWRVVCVSM